VLAIALATIWSLVKNSPEHDRGCGRMRILLRFVLRVALANYGAVKLFPLAEATANARAVDRAVRRVLADGRSVVIHGIVARV
jgi:hypothetical protein